MRPVRTVVVLGALALIALPLLVNPVLAAPPTADQARTILQAAGVRGGLVVHLGCGRSTGSGQVGELTAALRATDAYLVHGLDTDPATVEAARATIRERGLYGPVSVDTFDGRRLPYVDNLVNLVVADDLGDVPMDEVMRVLAPGGAAYIKRGGKWAKTVKPRPAAIDDWTHCLHDATNNAVSRDTVVGPPRHLQWVGSPRWTRHHDAISSFTAMVSAGGRVFYVFDEGPTSHVQLPPRWTLVARDAFSGVVLWKRRITNWQSQMWLLKSGPAQLPRRLVAVGDTVYVALGVDQPLSALDAATGETLRTLGSPGQPAADRPAVGHPRAVGDGRADPRRAGTLGLDRPRPLARRRRRRHRTGPLEEGGDGRPADADGRCRPRPLPRRRPHRVPGPGRRPGAVALRTCAAGRPGAVLVRADAPGPEGRGALCGRRENRAAPRRQGHHDRPRRPDRQAPLDGPAPALRLRLARGRLRDRRPRLDRPDDQQA